MMFKKGEKLYAYQVEREAGENVAYVNYLGAPYVPSVALSGEIMSRIVDLLIESPDVSRVVLVQQRNYNYDSKEVGMLSEIANLYNFLLKQENVLSPQKLGDEQVEVQKRFAFMNYFLQFLKQDPVAAYFQLKGEVDRNREGDVVYFRLLEKIYRLLDKTELISEIKDELDGYAVGDRSIYESIFSPDIIPNYAFARLVSRLPENAKIVSQYKIGEGANESTVTILKKEDDLKYFYHLMPPEYFLKEEYQMLLNLARNVLIEHQPKADEFIDPERTRQVFFNIARDLIRELAQSKGISISYEQLNNLGKILVRHTIGFGLLEVLLQDENLQDVVLNAPISLNPIFLRHSKYDECFSNILLSQEDADSWAAKFRMISGRPLDEANPVLDTDLSLENVRARISIVQRPLSPKGLSYAIRRHRDFPWTLPLFIENKMINSFAAGLMSFLIDGSRTMLVAGTRSSGKTSLLGALMLEIKQKYRTIVVEDTLEIPVDYFRKLGYDILSMKVRSSLSETSNEITAEEGIRTSLRLGDSSLIVGEIRSNEAKALYEAMRVGALANVVAGTVHGSSPYSVFDRIVNDLGVPVTSFKATDLVVVANPVKSADGLHSNKRMVQLSEVRKHWVKDPLEEKGFVDLLNYNVEKDELEASDELINGNSEIIKNVAANVRGWAGNWDAVYDNILLRGKVKQEQVDIAKRLKRPELLEAKWTMAANTIFHNISEGITRQDGWPDSLKVFPLWKSKFLKEVEKN